MSDHIKTLETLLRERREYAANWGDDDEETFAALTQAIADARLREAAIALRDAEINYDKARSIWESKAPSGLGEIDNRSDADYAPYSQALDARRIALHELTALLDATP